MPTQPLLAVFWDFSNLRECSLIRLSGSAFAPGEVLKHTFGLEGYMQCGSSPQLLYRAREADLPVTLSHICSYVDELQKPTPVWRCEAITYSQKATNLISPGIIIIQCTCFHQDPRCPPPPPPGFQCATIWNKSLYLSAHLCLYGHGQLIKSWIGWRHFAAGSGLAASKGPAPPVTTAAHL